MKNARTTNKQWTFGEIIQKIPPLGLNSYLSGIDQLVDGYHPLPTLYMKQFVTGEYELVGYMSEIILDTLQLIHNETSNTILKRKIQKYGLSVIVFEPSLDQQNLIDVYRKIGFL